MEVTLTRFTNNPVMAIEEAASQCYQSEPSPDGKIMKQCYLSGHHSVLEHISFTWRIEGVSRALLAQLTRHRMASFSVKSQRYCVENGMDADGNGCGFDFVMPEAFKNDPILHDTFVNAMTHDAAQYAALLANGAKTEDARFVLPNACCTTLQCTMNLREFIHFCNERLCSRAQWEIRNLAEEMVRTVNEATDNAFAYMLVPKCEVHPNIPFCTESKCQTCGKHPRLSDLISNDLSC